MGRPSFDIAIVGGGAAGCVLARRLAEAGGRSVALVEAGPDLRRRTSEALRDGWRLPSGGGWAHDWGFQAEADAAGGIPKLRRGRLLGGTSWLTRFAVRGVAADFDAWAARGNPGWGFEDVLPAFRQLEADLEFGDQAWHGAQGPIPITRYPRLEPSSIHAAAVDAAVELGFAAVDDHNRPDAVGVGRMPMSGADGRRVTTVDAYLPLEATPPSLAIRADSPVAAVRLDGDRATGLRLVDGGVIDAAWVILAAGVYGSPAILMRSGIGPARHLRGVGIDVVADLPGVGENLADHPGVEVDSGWQGSGITGSMLHSIATFRSSTAAPDGPPDLMFWFADPAGDEPVFTVETILLKPESRGSVRLASADPAVAPRITLPRLEAQGDVERLAEGWRLAHDLISRPEIRRLAEGSPPVLPAIPEELHRAIRAEAYSVPHVVGTCRMGPHPDAGDVVDSLGRVHGIDGLSVIDASIIPDAPAGFPHLVTIMLAERLAERARAIV